MSTDYYLVSESEAIHVAQDGLSGFSFYSKEKDCMKKLTDFLERHKNKGIQFLDEHATFDRIEDGHAREIEWIPNHLAGKE